MKKIKDIVIYSDERFYSAFPSLVARRNGEIICAFRRAPDRRKLWAAPSYSHTDPNSYLVLVRSRDGGESWTKEPELIYAHPFGGSQDPCLAQLDDGSIVCTSYAWALLPDRKAEELDSTLTHPPYAFLGGYVLRSEDSARTWNGPFVPMSIPGDPTLDALGRPCPAYNRGATLQMPDGKIFWAAAAQERLQPRRTGVHLLISSDGGRTWHYGCKIASDEKVSFNETSLIRTSSGDIVAFMRTADFDGKLAVARSTDGGISFHPWEDGGITGHPFHALRLWDGRVFLVYGYRQAPFGIRAKILNPDCTDTAEAQEIVIRDDGGNGDIGYPWAALLPDEKILVAYYFNIADGTRYIAGSLLTLK